MLRCKESLGLWVDWSPGRNDPPRRESKQWWGQGRTGGGGKGSPWNIFLQFFLVWGKSPTMATIWRKVATKRKLARNKASSREEAIQVSFHWLRVTWKNGFNHIVGENKVILSLTKPLQRMRNATRTAKAWKSFLLKRSMLSEPFSVVWICVSKVPRICVNRIPRIC